MCRHCEISSKILLFKLRSIPQEGKLKDMKHSTLFYVALATAIFSLIIAVYFLVPGVYHPYLSLSSGHPVLISATKHPKTVMSAHRIYSTAFFALAAIFATVAFLSRSNKRTAVAVK